MTSTHTPNSDGYKHNGYSPGHPWYYITGGRPKRLKEILKATIESGYQGYARDDIKAADAMAEPQRSHKLRTLRQKFETELRRDISRYRECVRTLHQSRNLPPDQWQDSICNDVHTALSLKHNHIINGFAHLIMLDELLSQQMELFDF